MKERISELEDSSEKFTWNTYRNFWNMNEKLGDVEDSLRGFDIHLKGVVEEENAGHNGKTFGDFWNFCKRKKDK